MFLMRHENMNFGCCYTFGKYNKISSMWGCIATPSGLRVFTTTRLLHRHAGPLNTHSTLGLSTFGVDKCSARTLSPPQVSGCVQSIHIQTVQWQQVADEMNCNRRVVVKNPPTQGSSRCVCLTIHTDKYYFLMNLSNHLEYTLQRSAVKPSLL